MTATPCPHHERTDGVCTACGHCVHDIILNGACYYCGSTELDAVAVSPKPAADFVPASRLVRGRPGPGSDPDESGPESE